MAYPNFMPNMYPYGMNYAPQGQQMPQSYAQAPQQAPQPSCSSGIIWVQGEAGAKSYLVPPSTTVQLWDSEAQTIYVKSADASGMPSMKIIDYKIRDNSAPIGRSGSQEGRYATKDDISQLRSEIEQIRRHLEDLMEGER